MHMPKTCGAHKGIVNYQLLHGVICQEMPHLHINRDFSNVKISLKIFNSRWRFYQMLPRKRHYANDVTGQTNWVNSSFLTSLARVTSSRAPRRARRYHQAHQNGLGLQSMPNFEFLKSDHN